VNREKPPAGRRRDGELLNEEFEFFGGGVHRDLAGVLRLCLVSGAPHRESE
jgi:hypothetical protein